MFTFFGKQPAATEQPLQKNGLGIPGLDLQDVQLTSEQEAQLLLQPENKVVIGQNEIREAAEILQKYKQGKTNLEARIVEDEEWYKLRHWEVLNKNRDATNGGNSPAPSSAWLFNSIVNKHADAMDNYPEPVVLPREESDRDSAKMLSDILPVIHEYNQYESTYSTNWWEKLKHGTGVYGVFWNSRKENGLGDIDIKPLDLLQLFWEPGVTDIQKSRNFFICELVDNDLLEQQYPQFKGKFKGSSIKVEEYLYDDNVDISEKSVVVDWYYKKSSTNGRTLLHYVKFVNDCLLYATENDKDYRYTGWYEHGLYPVVFDTLFPEKGTPVGFGYVSICKDPQLYIDKLSANILESSLMNTKKRFFVSGNTDINEEEFLDWNKPLVHVTGDLGEHRIQEIVCRPLDGIYLSVMEQKIDEMKDTASNRDFNSGSSSGGVTAASAIAALQEAGNKTSRDMIAASYRAHTEVNKMCIELMRQFYDETRSFRIVSANGTDYEFAEFNNQQIKDQLTGRDANGVEMYRRPVFDLKIKAQRKNPFSRMEQNERAKELYQMGFFNPDRAQEALGAIKMMDFEGIEDVREHITQGNTLLTMVQQMSQQMAQMAAVVQAVSGTEIPPAAPSAAGEQPTQTRNANDLARNMTAAHTPQESYSQNLYKRTMNG